MIPPKSWRQWRERNGLPSTGHWVLKKWLYGQRKAAFAWTNYFAVSLGSIGFERDPAAPHFFYSRSRGIHLESHADDIHLTGPMGELQKFENDIAGMVKFKYYSIHGVESSYEHLKRKRIRSKDGTQI